MPIFNEDKSVDKKENGPTTDAKQLVRYPKILLISGLFFSLFSCGIESIFQSQSFTFGLCGPHKLTPQQVSTNQVLPLVFCR